MTDAPRMIWVYTSEQPWNDAGRWQHEPVTGYDRYHHDDVVQELREALEPFARYMNTDEGRMDRDNKGRALPNEDGVGWVYLTHGDFRRAEAALAKLDATPANPENTPPDPSRVP